MNVCPTRKVIVHSIVVLCLTFDLIARAWSVTVCLTYPRAEMEIRAIHLAAKKVYAGSDFSVVFKLLRRGRRCVESENM